MSQTAEPSKDKAAEKACNVARVGKRTRAVWYSDWLAPPIRDHVEACRRKIYANALGGVP